MKFGENHAAIEAANFFGAVTVDVVELSGDNNAQDEHTFLSFNSVDTPGPFRIPIEERESVGDFFYSDVTFDFRFRA